MDMRALVIGGTRNLGPPLVEALLESGFQVTLFNRGKTHADIPRQVERQYGDRTKPEQVRSAIGGREFELIIDTTLYNGWDAQTVLSLFENRTARYIFVSTGQVYLVRKGLERPYKEEDYAGPLIPEPPQSAVFDHDNWKYGIEKRAAEDVFSGGWKARQFPVTILRLPMVNSEADHFHRIRGYLLRLRDGGPILVPQGTHLPLRHVYREDVVQAVLRLAKTSVGKGEAYNISQDETLSLEEFLEMLAARLGARLRLVRIPQAELEEASLLPDCSPFSDPWMSALDNAKSKAELGMKYTPIEAWLDKLVQSFQAKVGIPVKGYARRALELELAGAHSSSG